MTTCSGVGGRININGTSEPPNVIINSPASILEIINTSITFPEITGPLYEGLEIINNNDGNRYVYNGTVWELANPELTILEGTNTTTITQNSTNYEVVRCGPGTTFGPITNNILIELDNSQEYREMNPLINDLGLGLTLSSLDGSAPNFGVPISVGTAESFIVPKDNNTIYFYQNSSLDLIECEEYRIPYEVTDICGNTSGADIIIRYKNTTLDECIVETPFKLNRSSPDSSVLGIVLYNGSDYIFENILAMDLGSSPNALSFAPHECKLYYCAVDDNNIVRIDSFSPFSSTIISLNPPLPIGNFVLSDIDSINNIKFIIAEDASYSGLIPLPGYTFVIPDTNIYDNIEVREAGTGNLLDSDLFNADMVFDPIRKSFFSYTPDPGLANGGRLTEYALNYGSYDPPTTPYVEATITIYNFVFSIGGGSGQFIGRPTGSGSMYNSINQNMVIFARYDGGGVNDRLLFYINLNNLTTITPVILDNTITFNDQGDAANNTLRSSIFEKPRIGSSASGITTSYLNNVVSGTVDIPLITPATTGNNISQPRIGEILTLIVKGCGFVGDSISIVGSIPASITAVFSTSPCEPGITFTGTLGVTTEADWQATLETLRYTKNPAAYCPRKVTLEAFTDINVKSDVSTVYVI